MGIKCQKENDSCPGGFLVTVTSLQVPPGHCYSSNKDVLDQRSRSATVPMMKRTRPIKGGEGGDAA